MFIDVKEFEEDVKTSVRRIEYIVALMRKAELITLKIEYCKDEEIWDSIKYDLQDYRFALRRIINAVDSLEKKDAQLFSTNKEIEKE